MENLLRLFSLIDRPFCHHKELSSEWWTFSGSLTSTGSEKNWTFRKVQDLNHVLLLDLPPTGSLTHPSFNCSHISASYRREPRCRSSLSLADVRFSAAVWQKLFFWQIRPMFTLSENSPVKAASVRVVLRTGGGLVRGKKGARQSFQRGGCER